MARTLGQPIQYLMADWETLGSRGEIASKPEPPTQMVMHLDSTLTLQTKKRYISRMPTDPESLRTKYRVDDQRLVTRTAPSTWSPTLRGSFERRVQRFSRGIIVDR